MTQPLRIAQVAPPIERVPPDGYGGTERVIYELVRELTARGHEVTTFASGDSERAGRARRDGAASAAQRGLRRRADGVRDRDDAPGPRPGGPVRHHPQPSRVDERRARPGDDRPGRRDVPRPARPAVGPLRPRAADAGVPRRDQRVAGRRPSGRRLDRRPQRPDARRTRRSSAAGPTTSSSSGGSSPEKGIVEAIEIAEAGRPAA